MEAAISLHFQEGPAAGVLLKDAASPRRVRLVCEDDRWKITEGEDGVLYDRYAVDRVGAGGSAYYKPVH